MEAQVDLAELVERLGLASMPATLPLAMVHRSYSYENGRVPTNERLEFLGDSVLGLVVTDHLYATFPDLPEGQLAKMRSAIVNAHSLAEIAAGLEVGAFLQLGRGEESTGGREKVSILADAMEAIIGAVYLELGLEGARRFILDRFGALIASVPGLGAGLDWKTSLQELAAQVGQGAPEYIVVGEGPDHARTFTARVRVGGQMFGHGIGRTKKQAEQQAAQTAFEQVQQSLNGDA
ncbi:MAG: ribonuclease III [Actinobacteria bacterium]|nr:ribonuclease III [Micrococcales bacterium]MCB0903499.1 ribonuclease III [Actinomycetota bacterium]MCB9428187.1 ribonuclease III [Actinomycetota bacterium]